MAPPGARRRQKGRAPAPAAGRARPPRAARDQRSPAGASRRAREPRTCGRGESSPSARSSRLTATAPGPQPLPRLPLQGAAHKPSQLFVFLGAVTPSPNARTSAQLTASGAHGPQASRCSLGPRPNLLPHGCRAPARSAHRRAEGRGRAAGTGRHGPFPQRGLSRHRGPAPGGTRGRSGRKAGIPNASAPLHRLGPGQATNLHTKLRDKPEFNCRMCFSDARDTLAGGQRQPARVGHRQRPRGEALQPWRAKAPEPETSSPLQVSQQLFLRPSPATPPPAR